MRLLFCCACAFSAFLAMQCSDAKGDLVISVTDGSLGSYSAGSINQVDTSAGPAQVQLSVWAHDTSAGAGARSMSGFNLAFSTSVLSDANFGDFTLSNSLFTTTINYTPSSPTNYDFRANTSGGAPTLIGGSTNPLKLFDITFSAAQGVQNGFYSFELKDGAFHTNGIGQPVNANVVAFQGGNIAIVSGGGGFQAVPEPSSMALLGVLTLGGAAYRRMRKIKAPNAGSEPVV